MRIVFIGCVISSETFLKAIHKHTSAKVVGVVTKSESVINADHVSLSEFAEANQIDWLEYKDNDQLSTWTQNKKPDIIYCFGWSYLLPKEIYTIPPLGAVGYHPTLLPKNRGRHPIIWSLVLGLKETGSTFFYLSDSPDSGDIISQEKVLIDKNEDANTLYKKLLSVGEKQVINITNQIMNGTAKALKQNDNVANYWRKRTKKDGIIDWRMDTKSILRLIRALTKPYVGAHFVYNNKEYTVWKAEEVNIDHSKIINLEPGKIMEVEGTTFIIKTGTGLLKILEHELDFKPKVGDYF